MFCFLTSLLVDIVYCQSAPLKHTLYLEDARNVSELFSPSTRPSSFCQGDNTPWGTA